MLPPIILGNVGMQHDPTLVVMIVKEALSISVSAEAQRINTRQLEGRCF